MGKLDGAPRKAGYPAPLSAANCRRHAQHSGKE